MPRSSPRWPQLNWPFRVEWDRMRRVTSRLIITSIGHSGWSGIGYASTSAAASFEGDSEKTLRETHLLIQESLGSHERSEL